MAKTHRKSVEALDWRVFDETLGRGGAEQSSRSLSRGPWRSGRTLFAG